MLELMGYRSPGAREVSRLRNVLDDPRLRLGCADYDFKYSNEEFIRELAHCLSLDPGLVDSFLEDIEQEMEWEARVFKPYIFVDTGFTRDNQPIFILALTSGQRFLPLPRESWGQALNIQISIGKELIAEHMESTAGKLGVWGTIERYLLYFSPNESLELSPRGQVGDMVHGFVPHRATISPDLTKLTRYEELI